MKETEHSVEQQLVDLLREKHMTVTTAESLTGGLVAATIVDVPGASEVLKEAYITYAESSKMRILSVPEETIKFHGVVSERCARDMVKGVAALAGADCAISVTGIAGPTGGSIEKPVGTVFAGFKIRNRNWVREFHFDGDREQIRRQTVQAVLEELLFQLRAVRIA